MAYDLFLFDLDDTLLDFQESERLSFFTTLQSLGWGSDLEQAYLSYRNENRALWKLFEENKTTKEILKVERFRKTFASHQIDLNPEHASLRYLEALPQTVVLIDHAVEICDWLSGKGEIGIITNGIQSVQSQRIANSKLAPYISFVCVSEECGFAKPDARFFEHSSKLARKFSKESALVIGDRFEADILGAQNFGVDSCWFNPQGAQLPDHLFTKYEIKHLSELRSIIEGKTT